MAICERCGVEIDDSAVMCPLCGTELSGGGGKSKTEPVNRQIMPEFVDEIRPLNVKQRARLAWEISTLMFLSAVIVVLFVDLISNRRIGRRGLNIPAFILLGIGIFTMGIEWTVDWYLFRAVSLSWSGLALVSVCPVAIILLFVHYRLRKYVDLKRFFHL